MQRSHRPRAVRLCWHRAGSCSPKLVALCAPGEMDVGFECSLPACTTLCWWPVPSLSPTNKKLELLELVHIGPVLPSSFLGAGGKSRKPHIVGPLHLLSVLLTLAPSVTAWAYRIESIGIGSCHFVFCHSRELTEVHVLIKGRKM